MPESDVLLSLVGVTAAYGRRPAMRDVTLSVAAGEVVGLVGPNGSGKTTLVRVASRALRPVAGAVSVAGRDPYRLPARAAARLVAVVPQDLVPAFSFTALEMVLMGRAPYLSAWGGGRPRDWERVRQAMVATGVQHLSDRPVEELSGGERRRVILAQALAQDAPVLLLDEPTTHLDIRHVLDVLAIVRALAAIEGKAIVAVLHDLTLASASCDRLVVLQQGSVVAEGPPARVVTTELLRRVYEVDAEVELSAVTGRPAIVLNVPTARPAGRGRRAHVFGGAGRGAPLMRLLAERGFQVSAGVLHATDTDAAAAERLNLLRVTVPAFSEIDEESGRECRRLLADAEIGIVCDAPYGPGNLANLGLALEAARSGMRMVVLEETPIEERDFTDGRATELWRALCALGEVARSYDEAAVAVG